MSWFKPRGVLDVTFEVSIFAKGLDGIVELVGGLLLLLVTPAAINQFVGAVTQHELSEDPNDFIASRLLRLSSGLTGPALRFAAAYLLLHGLVKVVLVGRAATHQALGIPVDDRIPRRLHRLPAIPDRAHPDAMAGRLDCLRRLRRLADLA